MSHPLLVGVAIGAIIGVAAPLVGAFIGAVVAERNLRRNAL